LGKGFFNVRLEAFGEDSTRFVFLARDGSYGREEYLWGDYCAEFEGNIAIIRREKCYYLVISL
jgi:hypothetical protein